LLNPNIPYLFSSTIVISPFLRYWKILEEVKPDLSSLKKHLKKIDARVLSIKKRGIEMNPEEFRKKLPKKGKLEVVLIFMPSDSKGKSTRCFITQRVSSLI
jgi:rRNA pseudouridine-1189 N-methylase Emg1 (Nep1/Mra1 family)